MCYMIKKFDEFIKEGFIGKTLDRYKSGEKRTENITKLDRFIENEIEWVDMGHPDYLFGQIDCLDYTMNGKEIENLKLPKDVEYLNPDVMDWIELHSKRGFTKTFPKKKTYTSTDTLNKIYFHIVDEDGSPDIDYFLGFKGDNLLTYSYSSSTNSLFYYHKDGKKYNQLKLIVKLMKKK